MDASHSRPAMWSQETLLRAWFFALGFVPISALGIAVVGWLPLSWSARCLVLPAVLLLVASGLRWPQWGRLALVGFLAGLVATGAYDATRLTLVFLGWWPEFIPAIGRMALDDHSASPLWGYAWRFLFNGGCMGVAYAMLPWRGVRSGTAFGVGVCFCLWASLLLGGEAAQRALFPLNALGATFSMIGHLDYGVVLGFLVKRWTAGLALPAGAPSPALELESSEA